MTTAQDIAAELGRDWIDCGAYERQSFEDEARRRSEGISENDKIDAAYRAISEIWSDTMSWEQIESLARVVVRAIDRRALEVARDKQEG
jgi:hypothetical protein